MRHLVRLSNGRTLLVEEGKESVHLALWDNVLQGPDGYIATIRPDTVEVMCNSNGASTYLVEGLNGVR